VEFAASKFARRRGYFHVSLFTDNFRPCLAYQQNLKSEESQMTVTLELEPEVELTAAE
jgi:hypothetical protein